MTTTPLHHCPEIRAAGGRRRQLRIVQLFLAGAAAIAMSALVDAALPDVTGIAPGPVRLLDVASGLPAPAGGPFTPQYPQTPPNLVGNGGFGAGGDDDQAQQQEQQALQQME